MNQTELLQLARGVLTIPTAPYHEQGVRSFVEKYCRGLGLKPVRDRVGNVMVKLGSGRAPLVFVAHMDHPGFEVVGKNRAEFLGGAPREMFVGSRVRFYGRSGPVPVKIRRIVRERVHARLFEFIGGGELRRGDWGMWDLPLFQVRAGKPSRRDAEGSGRQLHATAIDDVLSVAVVLATLTELVRRKVRTNVWAVFTRAEEVGFNGAVEVAKAKLIPREALVISMEMSRERPWAQMGKGPVVRIGDRISTFDSHAALFMMATAKRGGLTVQRALMDGGSCEATAFAGFGYRVGGLCLPLGNYHNIGPGMKPRAEYVSVSDLDTLVKLTVAAAGRWRDFSKVGADLKARVLAIRRTAPRELTD